MRRGKRLRIFFGLCVIALCIAVFSITQGRRLHRPILASDVVFIRVVGNESAIGLKQAGRGGLPIFCVRPVVAKAGFSPATRKPYR